MFNINPETKEATANQTDVMLVAETAAYLRTTVSRLFNLTRQTTRQRMNHPIPVIRFGKQLRFRKSDIDAWLTTLAQDSITPQDN